MPTIYKSIEFSELTYIIEAGELLEKLQSLILLSD